MKICSNPNCQHEGKRQPLSNFYKSKRGEDGLDYYCVDCRKSICKTEAFRLAQKKYGQSEKGKVASRRKHKKNYIPIPRDQWKKRGGPKKKPHCCKICGERNPENFYKKIKSKCEICGRKEKRERWSIQYYKNIEEGRRRAREYYHKNKAKSSPPK